MIDGRGPQLVAPVHQVHLAADAREVDDVGRRRVAAAHDHHVLVAIEVAVAGGAIGHAAAAQLLLAGQPQLAGHRARGHDDRAGEVGVKGCDELVGLGGEVHGGDVFHDGLRPEGEGLIVHVHG